MTVIADAGCVSPGVFLICFMNVEKKSLQQEYKYKIIKCQDSNEAEFQALLFAVEQNSNKHFLSDSVYAIKRLSQLNGEIKLEHVKRFDNQLNQVMHMLIQESRRKKFKFNQIFTGFF